MPILQTFVFSRSLLSRLFEMRIERFLEISGKNSCLNPRQRDLLGTPWIRLTSDVCARVCVEKATILLRRTTCRRSKVTDAQKNGYNSHIYYPDLVRVWTFPPVFLPLLSSVSSSNEKWNIYIYSDWWDEKLYACTSFLPLFLVDVIISSSCACFLHFARVQRLGIM